jgi:hypothetical protein
MSPQIPNSLIGIASRPRGEGYRGKKFGGVSQSNIGIMPRAECWPQHARCERRIDADQAKGRGKIPAFVLRCGVRAFP